VQKVFPPTVSRILCCGDNLDQDFVGARFGNGNLTQSNCAVLLNHDGFLYGGGHLYVWECRENKSGVAVDTPTGVCIALTGAVTKHPVSSAFYSVSFSTVQHITEAIALNPLKWTPLIINNCSNADAIYTHSFSVSLIHRQQLPSSSYKPFRKHIRNAPPKKGATRSKLVHTKKG
jgi:hypothetical protein